MVKIDVGPSHIALARILGKAGPRTEEVTVSVQYNKAELKLLFFY